MEGNEVSDEQDNVIWKTINKAAIDNLDGTCSKRNLVCVAENEQKDTLFWKKQKYYPYLFVSLIRFKHNDYAVKNIRDVMRKINAYDTAIAYYSYNHSEIIMLKLEKEYRKGLKFVLDQRLKIDILNMYSVFSVKEDILQDQKKIRAKILDEQVSVRFHIIIKDDSKIDSFLETLVKKLQVSMRIAVQVHLLHVLIILRI